MAPLPTGNSRVDEKLLSGDEYGTLPGTPATQEATDAKQKNRSQKNPKAVRPISPDGEEMQRQTGFHRQRNSRFKGHVARGRIFEAFIR